MEPRQVKNVYMHSHTICALNNKYKVHTKIMGITLNNKYETSYIPIFIWIQANWTY